MKTGGSYRKKWTLLCFCLLWLVSAFSQKNNIKAEIRERVDRKVVQFIEQRKQDCLERAHREAKRRVDSLLKSMAQSRSLDTFRRPDKPIRPPRPEVEFPSDSSSIRPFEDSSLQGGDFTPKRKNK